MSEQTGCEYLKCPDFKRTPERPDGFCSDPVEYVNAEGEAVCKRRPGAMVWGSLEAQIDRLTKENEELKAELRNIANAKPQEWDAEVRDQFQQWAQSRARAALKENA